MITSIVVIGESKAARPQPTLNRLVMPTRLPHYTDHIGAAHDRAWRAARIRWFGGYLPSLRLWKKARFLIRGFATTIAALNDDWRFN
jgi:hypothetical protein